MSTFSATQPPPSPFGILDGLGGEWISSLLSRLDVATLIAVGRCNSTLQTLSCGAWLWTELLRDGLSWAVQTRRALSLSRILPADDVDEVAAVAPRVVHNSQPRAIVDIIDNELLPLLDVDAYHVVAKTLASWALTTTALLDGPRNGGAAAAHGIVAVNLATEQTMPPRGDDDDGDGDRTRERPLSTLRRCALGDAATATLWARRHDASGPLPLQTRATYAPVYWTTQADRSTQTRCTLLRARAFLSASAAIAAPQDLALAAAGDDAALVHSYNLHNSGTSGHYAVFERAHALWAALSAARRPRRDTLAALLHCGGGGDTLDVTTVATLLDAMSRRINGAHVSVTPQLHDRLFGRVHRVLRRLVAWVNANNDGASRRRRHVRGAAMVFCAAEHGGVDLSLLGVHAVVEIASATINFATPASPYVSRGCHLALWLLLRHLAPTAAGCRAPQWLGHWTAAAWNLNNWHNAPPRNTRQLATDVVRAAAMCGNVALLARLRDLDSHDVAVYVRGEGYSAGGDAGSSTVSTSDPLCLAAMTFVLECRAAMDATMLRNALFASSTSLQINVSAPRSAPPWSLARRSVVAQLIDVGWPFDDALLVKALEMGAWDIFDAMTAAASPKRIDAALTVDLLASTPLMRPRVSADGVNVELLTRLVRHSAVARDVWQQLRPSFAARLVDELRQMFPFKTSVKGRARRRRMARLVGTALVVVACAAAEGDPRLCAALPDDVVAAAAAAGPRELCLPLHQAGCTFDGDALVAAGVCVDGDVKRWLATLHNGRKRRRSSAEEKGQEEEAVKDDGDNEEEENTEVNDDEAMETEEAEKASRRDNDNDDAEAQEPHCKRRRLQ